MAVSYERGTSVRFRFQSRELRACRSLGTQGTHPAGAQRVLPPRALTGVPRSQENAPVPSTATGSQAWSYCRVLRGGSFLCARYPCTVQVSESRAERMLGAQGIRDWKTSHCWCLVGVSASRFERGTSLIEKRKPP